MGKAVDEQGVVVGERSLTLRQPGTSSEVSDNQLASAKAWERGE